MRTSNMMLATIVLVFIIYTAYSFSQDDFQEIELGSTKFCMPENDLDIDVLDQSQSASQFFGNHDHNFGSVQFIIAPSLVQENINEYVIDDYGLPAVLVLNLKVASSSDINRWLSGASYSDVLRLEGDFSSSSISEDDGGLLYSVSWSSEPPPYVIWHVLNRPPAANAVVPLSLSEYYVAYCSRAGGRKGEASNCSFSEGYNDFYLTITTSMENLKIKKQLIKYSKELMGGWKRGCVGEA
ncbi:hypothetical protein ACJJIK_04715 [Microbulbifer sp. ZKSA006]|uniref:hypothetical protein n=1 Tax=Microbulbifer sp. ZKSA006 TaxID=3243390 RepID=UPI004039246E